MARGESTRVAMIAATAELLEEQGYFGTGLKAILERSGAPRGSLYHHFPGGKEELAAEAVAAGAAQVGELVAQALRHHEELTQACAFIVEALAERLVDSGWRKGCPVATTALEASASTPSIQRACADAYAHWEATLAEHLDAQGHRDPQARAALVLSAIEGALLLARAHQDRRHLDTLIEHLPLLLQP